MVMSSRIERVRLLLSRQPSAGGDRGPVHSAVLVPLFEEGEKLKVVLIKRSEKSGLHRGQMGFPGGMAEQEDAGDPLRTALRETEEELGISAADSEVIGRLPPFPTVQSALLVQPFVGVIPWPCRLNPDPREVQSVHTESLQELADGVLGPGNRFGLPPPVYPVDDEPVWGLTAKILTELLRIIKPVIE